MMLKTRGLVGLIGLGAVLVPGVAAPPAAGAGVTAPAALDRPLSQARASDDSCPASWTLPSRFTDVHAPNPHAGTVDCVAHWGVVRGTSDTEYAPARPVTRAQMASFLVRVVESTGGVLADRPDDHFSDDGAAMQEVEINRLAQAGVLSGRAPGRFDPQAPVTRAQMAVFLTRAYEFRAVGEGRDLLAAGGDHFWDDDGSPLHTEIDKAAAAGFAGGYGDGSYRPGDEVRRDQMASFLARVLDLVVENGMSAAPEAPTAPSQPAPEDSPPPYAPPTRNVVELVSCTRSPDNSFYVEVHHTISGGSWELPSGGYGEASRHWSGEPVSALRGLLVLRRPNPDEPITLSAMVLRTITIAAPGGAEPTRVVIKPPPDFVVHTTDCRLEPAPQQ